MADETGAKTLTAERLASLWDDLADADAGKACAAGWQLAADPAASVPFLQKHLRPAEVDAARIAKLLAALDGDDFKAREKASRGLAELGDLAGPAVRQALAGKPSPETRRRLEQLARGLDKPVEDAEEARALRGVEVLEHIGSADARKLLEELSHGAEGRGGRGRRRRRWAGCRSGRTEGHDQAEMCGGAGGGRVQDGRGADAGRAQTPTATRCRLAPFAIGHGALAGLRPLPGVHLRR